MNNQLDWDRFTGQWLRTVRALRRDSNYCRLALAMARADDQCLPWDHYLRLAQTWKGIHEDQENDALQRHCVEYTALGWSFAVEKNGLWIATAPGIESTGLRLAIVLANVRDSAQPLREEWDRHYNERKANREAAQP